MVSTGGGAFQLEDTTFCGGGVRFDLEEGVILRWRRCVLITRRGSYFRWTRGNFDLEGSATSTGGGAYSKQWSGASSCR